MRAECVTFDDVMKLKPIIITARVTYILVWAISGQVHFVSTNEIAVKLSTDQSEARKWTNRQTLIHLSLSQLSHALLIVYTSSIGKFPNVDSDFHFSDDAVLVVSLCDLLVSELRSNIGLDCEC